MISKVKFCKFLQFIGVKSKEEFLQTFNNFIKSTIKKTSKTIIISATSIPVTSTSTSTSTSVSASASASEYSTSNSNESSTNKKSQREDMNMSIEEINDTNNDTSSC